MFDSYARYWAESFRLPGTGCDELEAGLRTEGYDRVVAALDGGNGCILAMPHLGGWEWAGFWLALVPRYTVSAVAEALEPPELARWFTELRARLGIEVILLGADAGSAVTRFSQRRSACRAASRAAGSSALLAACWIRSRA